MTSISSSYAGIASEAGWCSWSTCCRQNRMLNCVCCACLGVNRSFKNKLNTFAFFCPNILGMFMGHLRSFTSLIQGKEAASPAHLLV